MMCAVRLSLRRLCCLLSIPSHSNATVFYCTGGERRRKSNASNASSTSSTSSQKGNKTNNKKQPTAGKQRHKGLHHHDAIEEEFDEDASLQDMDKSVDGGGSVNNRNGVDNLSFGDDESGPKTVEGTENDEDGDFSFDGPPPDDEFDDEPGERNVLLFDVDVSVLCVLFLPLPHLSAFCVV